LHRGADIADSCPGECLRNAFIQALFGHLAQPLRRRRDVSGGESIGVIAVEAVNRGTEVYGNDVTVFDDTLLARYAVNNFIIYGYACCSRKVIQMEEVRCCPL